MKHKKRIKCGHKVEGGGQRAQSTLAMMSSTHRKRFKLQFILISKG